MTSKTLDITHPDLCKEWQAEKNGDLRSESFRSTSTQKIWWQCPRHGLHTWEARIDHRARGSGCPFCSNNRVLAGFNDLEHKYPEITKEWHPSKNGALTAKEVNAESNKKVWWRCSEFPSHDWETAISKRTKRGDGCPICSGKQVLEGFNDLATTHSDLAREWHPTKNSRLTPQQVSAGSSRKSAWWRCTKHTDHEWTSPIFLRTGKQQSGCPICANKKVLPGFNDLATTHPDLAREWHPTKNGSLTAQQVTAGSSRKSAWWQCQNYQDHEWHSTIRARKDIEGCPICNGHQVLPGFNDLQTLEPQISKEWHSAMNGSMTPSKFTRYSGSKVWWQCLNDKTHFWDSRIVNRTLGNQGCPICSCHRVLQGSNDLATLEPNISKEWHPSKNGNLKPSEIARNSNKKIWWQCLKHHEHEWRTSVAMRSQGSGCPICSGRQVLKGFNDLATTHPDLAKEWHPTKNKNKQPTDVVAGSGEKVWWQCKKHYDHEWYAVINSRKTGANCPICSNQNLLVGFNDLQTINPKIASGWHPTKNGLLTPKDVLPGSNRKVWWQCGENLEHNWNTSISNRSRSGCPSCSEYGFNPSKESWFYLMQRPGEQQFGITNDLTTRLRRHEGHGWILLEHTEPASGQKVFDTERLFKKWLRKEIGLMEGTTENWSTTKMEVQSLAELKARSGIETDLF